MYRLSIVIPVLNKLKKLEDTLVSILENRPSRCEIIVVLNEPYDDPYQLSGEVCFVEAAKNANLIESINCGLTHCTAPVVHILTCGMEVSPGWSEAALAHFTDPKVASVAPLVLHRLDRSKIISAGVSYRAGGKVKRLGYGKSRTDASFTKEPVFGADILAAFYRRSTLEAVDGLNPTIGGQLTGVDLALAMHFAGFHSVYEPECEMYIDPEGVIGADRVSGGCAAERLFWTWAHRWGMLRAVSGHVALITGECLETVVRPSTLFRLGGRAWGALRFPFRRRIEKKEHKPASIGGHAIAAPHFATKKARQSASCSDE